MSKYHAILAETHPAEYMMHKYWARKPHNVLSYFLGEILPNGGNVLDPFCGSGVTLHEARKLHLDAVGFDINPIAVLISQVLIAPPSEEDFVLVMKPLLEQLIADISPLYQYDGKDIRYIVHSMMTVCENCGARVPQSKALGTGRKKICPYCQGSIKFNAEHMIGTEPERIYVTDSMEPLTDESVLAAEAARSSKFYFDADDQYNRAFTTNKRILAFHGMHTKDLFTPRNFSILSHISDVFQQIKNDTIRRTALLMLSGSIAQCSRLIPVRNNMSTGGPAWSVPGFWVPAEHLESNPLLHIIARYKKFRNALRNLNASPLPRTARVFKIDAIKGMQRYRAAGKRADFVFFDPPYGDNVPYVEFSAIWNSFLGDYPSPEEDISVSDRSDKSMTWTKYTKDLDNILREIAKTLSASGKLLVTFNNNDIKAWTALIQGLQKNHLVCEYDTYQIPAVVSAKAQFSPSGSYISDIYSLYHYDPDALPSRDLSPVITALKKVAEARDGIIAKNLIDRVLLLEWIDNNIAYDLLSEKTSIIYSLFTLHGSTGIYKHEISPNAFRIEPAAREKAKAILKDGPCPWKELYQKIAVEYADYGFLDPNELRKYLGNHVLMEKKQCLSYLDEPTAG